MELVHVGNVVLLVAESVGEPSDSRARDDNAGCMWS
jgi:hypothetical protein